ncbi:hypothetical protein WA026_019025 [Henosepilachna vigintioctopunctata]|uniref:Myb/SANT-like DNA-binding domain-containing protein n=1 Tax=Henosepilachna vigintioctopunctata TaxID=420089 RepID=A0AAW1VGL9_9CUCU
MSKSRLCKIIPAEVTDVIDGSFIVNLPDGEQYKVEGGNIPMKKGSLIRFGKNSFLKLTNDFEEEPVEEITILKVEPEDHAKDDFDTFSSFAREKNHAVWEDKSTRMLIDMYKEIRPSVDGHRLKTMRNMWERISDRLHSHGYTFDYQQVESKWKSLVRSYRSGLVHGARRKAHYQAGPFEHEIAEILSSQGVSYEVINMDENAEEDSHYSSVASSSADHDKGTTKNNQYESSFNDGGRDLSLLVKAIYKRIKQKENADKVKEEQREKLISAIQERNQLLKKIYLLKDR